MLEFHSDLIHITVNKLISFDLITYFNKGIHNSINFVTRLNSFSYYMIKIIWSRRFEVIKMGVNTEIDP